MNHYPNCNPFFNPGADSHVSAPQAGAPLVDLREYGNPPALAQGVLGRVTAAFRDRVEVITAYGPCQAQLRGSALFRAETVPVTGDWVQLDYLAGGQGRIAAVLPRRTMLSRPDPAYGGQREQVVAANFDYAFLLSSLNHDFNLRRLERYLTAAWQSGATPVVLLTKADLGEAADARRQAEAAAIGAAVHVISARTGQGLDALEAYLRPGMTAVFLGSSGVGKSSLVNALAGGEWMATGAIREDDSRGRHTTTHRQLLRLPSGALVIDTPGMRALGMWDVTEGLDESFADVAALAERCRFRNCTHRSEPGCAVRAALAEGSLPQARWDSYCKLRQEAAYADAPEAYLRRKTEKNKQIAQFNRKRKTKR